MLKYYIVLEMCSHCTSKQVLTQKYVFVEILQNDILFFFLIKNCNCSIFWLLYMIICSEMIWHIYYSKSEVEEMKKAMEEELRKNQEEIENMKKTWQERLSEQETANKVQIFPMYFFISHFLYTSLRFISSYHSFFLMNNKTSGYRVMLMQNAKSRKRKRLFPTFGICMKTLP